MYGTVNISTFYLLVLNLFVMTLEAEFFDEIQTKVFEVFLLAIHRHVYRFALRFYFFKLTQPFTVFTVQLLYSVKEKGGKSDRKQYPLPYGLRNPDRNLKSENSQD